MGRRSKGRAASQMSVCPHKDMKDNLECVYKASNAAIIHPRVHPTPHHNEWYMWGDLSPEKWICRVWVYIFVLIPRFIPFFFFFNAFAFPPNLFQIAGFPKSKSELINPEMGNSKVSGSWSINSDYVDPDLCGCVSNERQKQKTLISEGLMACFTMATCKERVVNLDCEIYLKEKGVNKLYLLDSSQCRPVV